MRPALALLCMLGADQALAQISGSVGLMSDYRFRGVSLSRERPVPQMNVNYDSAGGWYAGAFASKVWLQGQGNDVQVIGYGGYAAPLSSGLRWEAGFSETDFVQCGCNRYAEIFAGINAENLNARMYFSPDYAGSGQQTGYLELNGHYAIRDGLQWIAHLGYLRSLSAPAWPAGRIPSRFDTRLGIGAGFSNWNVQVAWVAAGAEAASGSYLQYGKPQTRALVLSAQYFF